jgi:hypothetical protein
MQWIDDHKDPFVHDAGGSVLHTYIEGHRDDGAHARRADAAPGTSIGEVYGSSPRRSAPASTLHSEDDDDDYDDGDDDDQEEDLYLH